MEKKTARQRFLRRSRALTLTISIPSLSLSSSFKVDKKRSESVMNLKRSQSSREVWRPGQCRSLSASENCLDIGAVSAINVSEVINNNKTPSPGQAGRTSGLFGYKLKRSLTVSHILDNINKSFRLRRSASQREMAQKKYKTSRSGRMSVGEVRGSVQSQERNRAKSRTRVQGLADIDPKFISQSGLCSSSELETSRGSIRIQHLTGSNLHPREDTGTRLPRLEECAHFHYEFAEIGPLQVELCAEEEEERSGEDYLISVTSLELGQHRTGNKRWFIRRTLEEFQSLDRQLHTCVYDRRYSQLPVIHQLENIQNNGKESVRELLSSYLERFSSLAGPLVTCGPVLSWLEVDNRGNRLIITDDSDINTPAVAAAYAVKRYSKQAQDEISFEVGDMISVIDMPPSEESIWWRGKRGFEVGFFPCECVEVIGDKVPNNLNLPHHSHTLPHLARRDSTTSDSPSEPTKPVLRKHGKLITFFRSFILSRPARGKLKKSGILKERVFGCDLGEHLLNTGQDVPKVLKHCSKFIEARGIVDGIYRLSGISSNIQRLRVAFDEDRVPDLFEDRLVLQDIHSVSSLLKMYFRELPNPVCTFHLYEKFVEAARSGDEVRLPKLRDVVAQLPPPNYRTLEYLTKHLHRVSLSHNSTGMTAKNVAIVWAPNLLRCKSLEVGGVAALQGVGVQAVVTEYLIKYCELIFTDKLPQFTPVLTAAEATSTPRIISRNRPKSLAISTPTKLVSLEEARSRVLTASNNLENQKYIEVGGGPDNLPQKYHTVIELPGKKGGSFKHKKSTAWKSIFSGKEKKKSLQEERKISTPCELHLLSSSQPQQTVSSPVLRPVRSAESLVPCVEPQEAGQGQTLGQILETPQSEVDMLAPLETVTRAVSDYRRDSPKCHSRSSSHDSYFERKLGVQFKIDMESEAEAETEVGHGQTMKVDSSLDISEIQMNFDLEENEMKIFSEDEAMMSTSVGSELSLPRSPLEDVTSASNRHQPVSSSPAHFIVTRGSNQRNESPLESPTKSRRMSFKEKFKKFTSPTMSRKQSETSKMVDSGVGFDSDSCSGSYENKSFDDGKKASKLKEKIVAALSPESLRKKTDNQEISPKKKKSSVSPGTSPYIGSMIKRSKIEDDISEMSSINLSPSIKFIDASSSYELGLGASDETLEDSLISKPDTSWNEGSVTVRENFQREDDTQMQSSIVEAEVHELLEKDEELVGPISIIGASIDVDGPESEERSQVEQNHFVPETENFVRAAEEEESSQVLEHADVENSHLVREAQKEETKPQEDTNLVRDTEDGDKRLKKEANILREAESEVTKSMGDESIVKEAEDEEIRPVEDSNIVLAAEHEEKAPRELFVETEAEQTRLEEEVTETEAEEGGFPASLSSGDSEETTSSLSSASVSYAGATVSENESFGVETTSPLSTNDDEIVDTDEQKVAQESEEILATVGRLEERDNDSHYTAMEIDEDKKSLINKQKDDDEVENELEIEDFAMETDMTIMSAEIPANNKLYVKSDNKTVFNFHYSSDSDHSDSSESPIESNTSERSECPPKEIETSNHTSAQSSPCHPPHFMLELEAVADTAEDRGKMTELKLDLSPPLESVVMRRSPSSPARNRSVRSDFLNNFVVEDPPSPQTDIGRPPLPKTSPPKFTGIAKALSPQPYNKPINFDAQTKLSRSKFSLHSAESVRSPPSPQQTRRVSPVYQAPDLSQEMQSIMEEKTLLGTLGQADRDRSGELNIMEEKSLDVTGRLRLSSLSPEPEVGSECVSLELAMSPVESGRRSTQGIPEVRSRFVLSVLTVSCQVERNVKFSHPDIRTGGKKSDRPSGQVEGGVTKNRSKSSTLSLHAVAAGREQEEEPLLQRRNSIHNVPFVDVNDPDTRTRMERYKEERRSMLRAKYKAEDYLSTTFARKKKVSLTSSQDSCDGDSPSFTVRSNKSISMSPPDSPDITDNNIHSSLARKTSAPVPAVSPCPNTPPSSSKISRKKIDLQKTELIPSIAPPRDQTDSVIYKSQVITSVQKPSAQLASRPGDLAISSLQRSQENNSRSTPSPPNNTEDNVNVKERASIFGPRKFSESKVRTVSAPTAESKSFNKKTSGNINRQTSPNKIKNMAALFEQKN